MQKKVFYLHSLASKNTHHYNDTVFFRHADSAPNRTIIIQRTVILQI